MRGIRFPITAKFAVINKFVVIKAYIHRKLSFVTYIHQLKDWPHFKWKAEKIHILLVELRHLQGKVMGKMQEIGFPIKTAATLKVLTLDVIKTSEIEGEILEKEEVRSSIARRLGIDIGGLLPSDKKVEGVVEMMLDATQNFEKKITADRLFSWQTALFASQKSNEQKIRIGTWRDNEKSDPMQVVSGPMGKEKIHYQAPDAELLPDEMEAFVKWINVENDIDPVLKTAIAHLWFVTIHPFDDGNGRIARAITDLLLARSEKSPQRFYSMSAQIRKERNAYHAILEKTQKGGIDITEWIEWFLSCLYRSIADSENLLSDVMIKSRFWTRHEKENFNDRQKLMLNKLLDGFEGKLNSSKWAKITKTSTDTALRDITDLLQRNILIKEDAGGRSTSYGISVEGL